MPTIIENNDTNRDNMGLGRIGNEDVVFKRKFRWTFAVRGVCNGNVNVPEHYVKIAARPNISIEETEINFLNGKMFIPGKATWETITVTYFDVAKQDNMPLYDWLASVYDFTNPNKLKQGSSPAGYSGTGLLTLYDGCAFFDNNKIVNCECNFSNSSIDVEYSITSMSDASVSTFK